jgi:tetratricopeptide (TPR) repeat protein
MIYQWGLRLVPETPLGKRAAFVAALVFLVMPGPLAALIMHQDLAPVAELIFLGLTYVIWGEIERTPESWSGRPSLEDPEQKRWLLRWAGIAFLTYLGYKSKADLKLVPFILGAYVLLLRRRQWMFFAVPIGLMLLLAVPWGPGIFTKLPPFVPGSQGSEINWMWQPASFSRFFEFLWSSAPFHALGSLREPTISLAGLLGPFILLPLAAFLVWLTDGAIDRVPWKAHATTVDRARIFTLIWVAAMLLAVSALPAINYTFRIRYGILTMVPVSLVLAWAFGLFTASLPRLPSWTLPVALACVVLQCGINLYRSIAYRRDMGQVMVAVDQVYESFQKNYPNEKLTLLPDFRPYDYRPDAAKAFTEKEWLSRAEDLPGKNHERFRTYAISWNPSLWDQLEVVGHFTGCRETSFFDRIFSCRPGSGTYLMRYIGADPLYGQGETLRSKRDFEGAKKAHEEYVGRYPGSMAGYFVIGLEAFELKDWARSEQAYSALEKYFPDHLSILYNHALALGELKDYPGAVSRLSYIAGKDPGNYAVLINLYWAYIKSGQEKRARELLVAMKRAFPNDGEINRLIAGGR